MIRVYSIFKREVYQSPRWVNLDCDSLSFFHPSHWVIFRYTSRAGFAEKSVPVDPVMYKVGLIGLGRAGKHS